MARACAWAYASQIHFIAQGPYWAIWITGEVEESFSLKITTEELYEMCYQLTSISFHPIHLTTSFNRQGRDMADMSPSERKKVCRTSV